jgi:hypothetical protein
MRSLILSIPLFASDVPQILVAAKVYLTLSKYYLILYEGEVSLANTEHGAFAFTLCISFVWEYSTPQSTLWTNLSDEGWCQYKIGLHRRYVSRTDKLLTSKRRIYETSSISCRCGADISAINIRSPYISNNLCRFGKLSVKSTHTLESLSPTYIPKDTRFLTKSCFRYMWVDLFWWIEN